MSGIFLGKDFHFFGLQVLTGWKTMEYVFVVGTFYFSVTKVYGKIFRNKVWGQPNHMHVHLKNINIDSFQRQFAQTGCPNFSVKF